VAAERTICALGVHSEGTRRWVTFAPGVAAFPTSSHESRRARPGLHARGAKPPADDPFFAEL